LPLWKNGREIEIIDRRIGRRIDRVGKADIRGLTTSPALTSSGFCGTKKRGTISIVVETNNQ